jgi:hypothetical protein
MPKDAFLSTPDGRYFIVRDRLWRLSNPSLPAHEREQWVGRLMDARRALRGTSESETRADARRRVNEAKVALGERGDPWWTDGAPDFNRRMVGNSPYAEWFAKLRTRTPDDQQT